MPTREEMIVRWGADAAGLEAGTNAMLNRQREASNQFKEIWRRAAEGLIEFFSLSEAFKFGKELIAGAKEIEESAARLGVSTTEVQKLGYAATMTGKDIDTIANSFDRLARAKESAMAGNRPDQDAFAQFGIGLTELNNMSPDELFSRIAESVEKTGVNSKVTADAMQLMGKSAGELLPSLKELSELKRQAPLINDEDVKNLASAAVTSRSIWENVKAISATALSFVLSPIEGFENTQFKNSAGGSNMNRLQYLLAQQQADRAANTFGGSGSFVTDLTKMSREDAARVLEIQKEITAEQQKQAQAGLDLGQKQLEVKRQIAAIEYQIKQGPWEGKTESEIADLKLQKEKLITQEKASQLDLDNQASNLARRIGQNQAELAQREMVYPDIGDVAGRRYTRSLARLYGPGGQYDLGRGNGFMAGVARDYELEQYQLKYDLLYGNATFDKSGKLTGGAAFEDQQRLIKSRNFMISAGVARPELQWQKIEENTHAMMVKLDALVGGGAVIKTDIVGTD